MNKEFLDKLDFYQKAYEREVGRAKEVRLSLEKTKTELNSYVHEKIDLWLGEDLDASEKTAIQEMGISLDTIFKNIQERRTKIPEEIEAIRKSEFYQKYLKMTINYDYSLIFRLEDDETFRYMVIEDFHNDEFRNRPSFKIPLFGTYQPRYWKFAKVANKVAKRHDFENYETMFATWKTFRDIFSEIIEENTPVKDTKAKFEKLQAEIKAKNDELNQLAQQEMERVVDKVSAFVVNAEKLSISSLDANEITFINTNKAQIQKDSENLKVLDETVNQIMKNMGYVQQLSVDANKLAQNPELKPKLESILEVQDPTQNLFEILTMEQYNKAMDAFKAYDKKHFQEAKVHQDQAKYNVTDLTPEQIQYLMKKYNVQEGEAFEPDPEDIRKLKLMG